jgi:DNA-binding SARP family transcriptional activator
MTPVMAEGLTGTKESRKILEGLSRNNFFTVRRRGKEPSYQYHPLFREFLIEKARGSIPAEEFVGLEARAGALLEDAGYAEDAAGLFIDAGQWEGMIGLIMKQAMPMVMQGRSHVLENWLKGIPTEIFNSMPWLQYWMGLCRLPFNPAEAEGYFKNAFEKFNARNDATGAFLSWAGVVDSISYRFDSCKGLDPWIDMFDELVKRFRGFPSEEIETRVTASMYFSLIMRRPDHPEFNRWQARALELAEKSPDVNLKIQIITYHAWFCFYTGDSTKAVQALDSLKSLLRSDNVTPFSHMIVATAASMQAPYSTTEADYDVLAKECLKTVEDSLEFSRRTGVHVLDFQITGTAVWITTQQHDFASAEKYAGRMKAVLGHVKRFDSGFYYNLIGFMELEKGNLQQALKYIETILEGLRYLGAFLSDFGGRLTVTHIRNEAGDYKGALESVSDIRKLGEKIRSPYLEYMALIAESHIHLGQGRDKEGLPCLRRAMAIGREKGYFNHMNWRKGVMAKLCTRALEEGIETEYVKKLIRVRKLMPDEPPVHIEDWPWRLKMYTLARFEVIKDNGPLRFRGKAPQRPLEMLKALIALGGRDISQERLSDVLWPDADGDAAQKSFATTLFRLRQLLGMDEALSYGEGRLTLNDSYCWVDAWSFLRVSGQADAEWNRRPEHAARLSEKAVAMYFGTFLSSDAEKPWAISMRERLRSRYLRNVERLGRHLEGKDQWERAVECYRKGIETDNLAEEFYQRLMLCHHRLGRRAEALRVYDRCRETLRAVLGVSPSEETMKLMKKIKSSKFK